MAKKDLAKVVVTEDVMPVETTYSKDEIQENAKVFHVSGEMMAGALRLSKKEKLTRLEVTELINKFKKRGV